MIVRSVFAVPCLSVGVPSVLTSMWALPSDQPRAGSLELSRFRVSSLGKMAVFDKTEPL